MNEEGKSKEELNLQIRTNFLIKLKSLLPNNPMCVEVGVAGGHFSKVIKNRLNPSRLHLIDPWEIGSDKNGKQSHYGGELSHMATAHSSESQYLRLQKVFSEEISSKRVVLHRGYSYDFASSFNDEYFDFIYIDACHLYDCVKADLEMFLPKLKKQGLMCGHDYFEDRRGSNFGVIKAVDEFCEKYDFEMIILSDRKDWCLRKKQSDEYKRGYIDGLINARKMLNKEIKVFEDV
jgi:hypothetical protein